MVQPRWNSFWVQIWRVVFSLFCTHHFLQSWSVVIHPSSCELSLNNELAAYVVLSLRGTEALQAAAGSVSRHLPSLHVDPGICRLVRWLSHVWLSSSIPDLCRLLWGPSGGSADVSCFAGFPLRLFIHIQQQSLWKALYLPIWIRLFHLREGKAAWLPKPFGFYPHLVEKRSRGSFSKGSGMIQLINTLTAAGSQTRRL